MVVLASFGIHFSSQYFQDCCSMLYSQQGTAGSSFCLSGWLGLSHGPSVYKMFFLEGAFVGW